MKVMNVIGEFDAGSVSEKSEKTGTRKIGRIFYKRTSLSLFVAIRSSFVP
jgi:hypothetical protein